MHISRVFTNTMPLASALHVLFLRLQSNRISAVHCILCINHAYISSAMHYTAYAYYKQAATRSLIVADVSMAIIEAGWAHLGTAALAALERGFCLAAALGAIT